MGVVRFSQRIELYPIYITDLLEVCYIHSLMLMGLLTGYDVKEILNVYAVKAHIPGGGGGTFSVYTSCQSFKSGSWYVYYRL